MYLHLFLLLFNSGASSRFLPLKQAPHLQNKTKNGIIDEMLCLLEAEKDPINVQFYRPLLIKDQICAHFNTEKFIHELKKISTYRCMKIVEKDMKRLEEKCSILKKSSSNDQRCLEILRTNFSRFKESLEEFLKWVNERQDCRNITRMESGLYLEGNCSCSGLWKYRQGLL